NALYGWGGFLAEQVVPKATASATRWRPYRVRERAQERGRAPMHNGVQHPVAQVVATAVPPSPSPLPVSIVLVIGESLNPDHMGVLGYARDTTPVLSERVKRFDGGATRIMASGVSTRVSVPMLVNVVREPGHVKAMGQTGNNLFVAAKRHGYQTAFVSVQKLDGLSSLMGGRMLDH